MPENTLDAVLDSIFKKPFMLKEKERRTLCGFPRLFRSHG